MKQTAIPHVLEASAPPRYDHHADLDYFIANQDEFVEKYNGKILVIRNQNVECASDTILHSCAEGDRRFGKGNFSVQKCIAGPKAYTMKFRNIDLTNYESPDQQIP